MRPKAWSSKKCRVSGVLPPPVTLLLPFERSLASRHPWFDKLTIGR